MLALNTTQAGKGLVVAYVPSTKQFTFSDSCGRLLA